MRATTVTELLNFVTECERIGDYAVNIMEKAEELHEKEVVLQREGHQGAAAAGECAGTAS